MSRVKIRELTEAENFDPDTDYIAIAQGNPISTRKLKVNKIIESANERGTSDTPFYFCDRTQIHSGSSVNETKIVTFDPTLTDGNNKLIADATAALGAVPTTIIVEMYIDVTSSPTGTRTTRLFVSGDPTFTKTSRAQAKNISGSRNDGANTGCANLQAFVPLDHDPQSGTYSLYYKWTNNTPSEFYIHVVGFGK